MRHRGGDRHARSGDPDAHGPAHGRAPGYYDLGLASEVDGHHLAGDPVGEPEAAVVPRPDSIITKPSAIRRGAGSICVMATTLSKPGWRRHTGHHCISPQRASGSQTGMRSVLRDRSALRRGFGGARTAIPRLRRWSQHRLNRGTADSGEPHPGGRQRSEGLHLHEICRFKGDPLAVNAPSTLAARPGPVGRPSLRCRCRRTGAGLGVGDAAR